jgi:hypothetical protein
MIDIYLWISYINMSNKEWYETNKVQWHQIIHAKSSKYTPCNKYFIDRFHCGIYLNPTDKRTIDCLHCGIYDLDKVKTEIRKRQEKLTPKCKCEDENCPFSIWAFCRDCGHRFVSTVHFCECR